MFLQLLLHFRTKGLNIVFTSAIENAEYCSLHDRISISNKPFTVLCTMEHALLHEIVHASGNENRATRNAILLAKNFYLPESILDYEESIACIVAIKLQKALGCITEKDLIFEKYYLSNWSTNIDTDFEVNRAFDFIMQNWLKDFEYKKDAA